MLDRWLDSRNIEKLSGTLGRHQAAALSKHVICFDGPGRKGNHAFMYNVDAVDRAINENRQITFRYFDYDENHIKVYRKNGNRYTANPVIMVWNKDNYYLLAFHNNHDDIVTYRLDKIDDIKIEDAERQPHAEYETFNTEEYRNQVFSMFGGELQGVTLSITREMITDVFDKFGDTAEMRKKDDDTYIADIEVQISRPFFAWIVGSQGKVRILHPCNVASAFNEFIAKIKETY